MDLQQLILAEHSKKQTDRIVKYVGNDPDRFKELIRLFFAGEYRVTQRAAWPLSYCVREHPELIQPYFRPLLDKLAKKGEHAAVVRNILRLLQDVTVPRKFHGRLMGLCFDFVQDPATPIAIKVFALTVLSQLAADYPEISGE